MKKRVLALLLFSIMVFSMIPITANAAEIASGTCGPNLTWTLDGTVLTIRGNGSMESYNRKTGPWGKNVTNVIIEEGVTTVGSYAFMGCTSLRSITIPDGVTSIENSAFEDCTSLTSITIPDSVTSIGRSAFKKCTSLTSIDIPNGITYISSDVFYGCSSLTSVTIPDSVTSIGAHAFCGCASLTSVIIPDSVTSVGNYAYQSCTSLRSITIPDSVTSLGQFAFQNCTSLTNINISDSVTSIGRSAFMDCTSLANINIPNSVRSIGEYAFQNCTSLANINIPDSVTSIGEYAFHECTSLASVSLSVTGPYAFARCSSLTNVTIRNGTTEIGKYAFFKCTSLTSITIPDSVTSIGREAFYGCTSLTSITIPNGVPSIGGFAFFGCTSLTSVTIPDSVKTIEEYAFQACTSLNDVYYSGSETDWKNIRDGGVNNYLFDATIHYNSSPSSNNNPCETQGHSEAIDIAKLPTCTTAGLTAGSHCSVCGEVLAAQKEIPATGHNFVNGICLICGINKNGSTPDDNPSIGTDVPSACSLSELTTVDYLAFSVLAYRDFKNVTEITSVQNFLGDIWDEPWSGDIKYGDLCKHIAGWEPFYVNENKSIGFYAVAFRNSKKEVVIAYRGSRPLSESWNEDTYNDWLVNDLPIILGNKKGTQLYDAIETYNDIAPTYGKSKIVTTGHSLGGALGDIVSAYSGCKGVTFNAVPALDAVYRGAVEIMGPTFAGIDKWNFVDQANENDILAGAWEARNEVVRIKPYVFYQSNATAINIPAHHGLESLVHKDSNENVVMNKQTASFKPNSTISSSVSLAENMSVDFGTSSNDVINKGLELLVAKTSYGGDGFDTITTNIHADTLVGGKHDDELDGGYGNDTYIYFKGDGKDTIIDVAGKDKLYLYGFENSDSFEIVDDEVAGYIFVRCNDNVIVQIKNNNRNQWLNSFKIYIQQGNKTTEHDITEYFSSKNYGAHVLIACPVEIEILDENGTVVYTVKDGEVGNYYTDYGNFYVYEEENGGYGKVLDLVEGYIFKIVGVGTGTMDISYQSVEADGLSEAQVITDVPVSESYVATLEENADGVFELKQINKDEESSDDTETSDIPDNSADITVSEVIEDTSDTSDVINTSNDSDSNSSGYGWIIVCVVVAVAIAGIIVYLLNKKKKTA